MAEEKDMAEETSKETSKETAATEEKAAEETREKKSLEELAEEEKEAEASEASGNEEGEAAEKKDRKDKKGFLSKKKDEEKEKLKLLVAELNDKSLRQMAEFENFRKRSEKEKEAEFANGAKSVIEKLLPVVDNFERGFSTVEEADEEDAFTKGMRMVYKQLMDELEKMDVKPIEAVGKEFDPGLHNAVMHVEDEAFGENTVAEELQKGYTYRGQVVRHSMVKVAN